jgi:adenosylcobinamide-GDP ribazoletransferase
MRRRAADAAAAFLLALRFLTRLPLPADVGYTPGRMAASTRWLPAAGAVIGALVAAVWLPAAALLPPLPAAVAATAASLLVTGAFHEDGLADCLDGLGGGSTRERALEIMRDSRIGSYGAAGLTLALLGRVALLAAAAEAAGSVAAALALVAAHAASRAASVAVIAAAPYARDHGTAKPVAEGITPGGVAVALATAALAGMPLALAVGAGAALAAAAGLALAAALIVRAFLRKLGGYTGDCLGATQQCAEAGFWLGLVAWL